MNIEEIDKWLDNEYGVSYTELEKLHDFVVDRDIEHQEQKDKVVNDLLKRISNLEFDVEDKQREIERLNNELEEFEKFQEEHRIMRQILIENNLWETLLNDDRFLEYLRK